MQEQQMQQEQVQVQEQQQKQPQKKKKKDNPAGLILIICIALLTISMFPFSIVKYSDGATRVITPATTIVINKTNETLWDNGEYRMAKPEIDVFLFPNNFKSYEELLEIKAERQSKQEVQTEQE